MTACAESTRSAAGRGTGARLELSLPLEPSTVAPAEGVSLGDAVRRRIGGSHAVHANAG
jgi:hypothetical protein